MRPVPDGFSGAIMAIEGIPDAAVLLHGPGGCRVRHMVLSAAVAQRGEPEVDFMVPYYVGYTRVPATFLDENDFIAGAYWKSEEGLSAVKGRDPSLVMGIDSPGAGLIGDDHGKAIEVNGLEDRAFVMTDALASVPYTRGTDRALTEAMRFLDPERTDPRPGTVNILGMSIMDKDWEDARDELAGYLEDMGLEVVACPGAGSTVRELVDSVNAELCVVVCPETCAELSEWYEAMGLRIVRPEAGAPVGFDALESWIRAVADATGASPHVPLGKVRRAKTRVRDRFLGMKYNSARIRGLTFSAAGIASVARPLTERLYSYLAMAPAAVAVDLGADPEQEEALRSFLESKGYGEAWGREPVPCDIVLCEGITALTMSLSHQCRAGIPIAHSSMGLDDVIPRPVYGVQGAFYILDELLHGVRGS